ncbi:MAG: hypothetical protein QG583_875 [Patescibacteria group bacterium]|jgi:hypothetical protein|nr:hypothetical protein [Patescibacteria group bacterium]
MTEANFDDLPWDRIMEIGEKGIFEQVFKKIPKFRFEFVVDEDNHEALVQSALKSLKRKNPDTTLEQAETLVGLMQSFARRALER